MTIRAVTMTADRVAVVLDDGVGFTWSQSEFENWLVAYQHDEDGETLRQGFLAWRTADPTFASAALVLDRRIVRPGATLTLDPR